MTRWSNLHSTCPEGGVSPFYGKIRLLQERVSESKKFPAELSELHSTWPESYLGRNNFFWRKKRIFLCSFPTFCRNLSKFRILFGRLGKRFRDCGWNFTPLVQTKILVGKTFCRISHVYKLLAVGLKNPEILWRKFSVRLSQLHPNF